MTFEDDDLNLVKWIPGKWTTVGVDRRTWRRWMQGSARIPHAVVVLAKILVNGDLGALDPQWEGWFLTRGKLWDRASGDQSHTPGTVRVWWWAWQRMYDLKPKTAQRALQEEIVRELLEPEGAKTSRSALRPMTARDSRSPYGSRSTTPAPQSRATARA